MSLMIWSCITFNGVGTLKTVNGNINAAKYIEILILGYVALGPYYFQHSCWK
jgi:hypothetical protein